MAPCLASQTTYVFEVIDHLPWTESWVCESAGYYPSTCFDGLLPARTPWMVEWKGDCENVAHWNRQGRIVECEGMGVSFSFRHLCRTPIAHPISPLCNTS